MIIFQSEFKMELSFPIYEPYNLEDILLFDIETTGLSASSSFLYLIGCAYYKNNTWHLIQWLADDMNSEVALLSSFFQLASTYKRLIHFNGSGFDIPYILKKCRHHNLTYVFDSLESYDIYKKLLPFKKLLPLKNLKLKTIEEFLNVEQIDCYTGEQLIPIYSNFLGRIQYERLHEAVHNKFNSANISRSYKNDISEFEIPSSKQLQEILLLHNSEDIKGLLRVANILYYTNLFQINTKDCTIIENNFISDYWKITLNIPFTLSTNVTWQSPISNKYIIISAAGNELTIHIPLIQGELKFFYDNFKDYYYLPKEDMAIHKNVAQFVDKEYRVKAKAFNCYTKQNGTFLPQVSHILTPCFKENLSDKISYIENTNPLLKQTFTIQEYIQTLLHYVSENKETKIIS